MPSFTKTIFALAASAALVAATPVPAGAPPVEQVKEDCPDTGAVGGGNSAPKTIFPELYTVYPSHPEISRPPVNGVHMEVYGKKSEAEQVVVFKGVPANAKECVFNVHMAPKHERVFVVNVEMMGSGDSALTTIYGMSKPATEEISWNSIQGLWSEETKIGGFEFSNWDPLVGGAHIGNQGYKVDCAEQIYIKTNFRQLNATKSVYMEQNENNGYFLEYKL
jgi:hypothetical protein